MILFKYFKNKSVKYEWFLTYIILFLLPMIICIILFVLVDGTIKKQVNSSNYFALKQIKQYMDTLATDTERVATDLALNYKVDRIRSFNGELTPEERYDIILLNRDMVNRNYASEIEEVYIYFKRIDTIVSSNNVMDSKSFFQSFSEQYGVNLNEWITINQKQHKGNYINLKSTNKKVAYMLTFPVNTGIDECINVVVILDESKLLEMIKDINAINAGKLAIVDKNDQVVLSSDNTDVSQKLKYNSFKDNSYVQYDNFNGNKVAIATINSTVEDWKYIYVMPTSKYWSQLSAYRELVLFGIFLSLIISCIVSYYLLKKNYEPINSLLRYLAVYQQGNKGTGNEYKIMQNIIMKSIDDKKELAKWMTFQKKVSNDKYLKELLDGNILDYSCDNNLVDIKFNWDYFSVTAFAIDIERYFSVLNSNPVESFELLQFIVNNMLNELLQNICQVYTVCLDDVVFCLMNFSSKDEECILNVKDVVIRIQEIVKKYYKIDFIIAMGNIYQGKDFIKQSYKETRQLLEFKEVVGGEDILVYHESKEFIGNENNYSYFYPFELEDALINALRSGDFSRISHLLEEIFNYNLEKHIFSSNMAQYLKYNIIGTLINTLNSIVNISGKKYNDEIISIEQLIQCKSIYKVKERLLIILKDICEKINIDKNSGTQIGEMVIDFIRENYKDENLNISAIANNFDLHPSYISKLFKIQVGEGLLDYLNKIRIGEAKKLMKTEKSNLESIAKKVGYSNIKTFSRTFIKIEGITPGKYREI